MNILVIGSGGREHTLVWKLKQSRMVKKIYATPGNAGIGLIANTVGIKADNIKPLVDFAERHRIDMSFHRVLLLIGLLPGSDSRLPWRSGPG